MRVTSTPIYPFYLNPNLVMEGPTQRVTQSMQEHIGRRAVPRVDKQPVPRVDSKAAPRSNQM